MSAGRTTWWPCDAAEHDRELNVELGEEFGADGPYLMRVLKDLAQAQRDDGRVRTGFRVLRTKTFIATPERVREVVEYAARIGALDDLEVDPDGREFTCRVARFASDTVQGQRDIVRAVQARARVTPARRQAVLARDRQCCECGATTYLEIDHIVPVARGGTGAIENLQVLCARCNRRKGAT